MTWIAVMAGGALGALARFLLTTWAARQFGAAFPWGTLGVNVAGSFAMGLVAAAMLRGDLPPEARAFLATGLLGGFTTFSAFSLEAGGMIERGEFALAGGYALASVVLCIAALLAGLALMRGALN